MSDKIMVKIEKRELESLKSYKADYRTLNGQIHSLKVSAVFGSIILFLSCTYIYQNSKATLRTILNL